MFMSRSRTVGMWAAFLACVSMAMCSTTYAEAPSGLPKVRYPKVDAGLDTIDARIKAQRRTVQQFKVFHDFQFTDKLNDSGITFVHHAVPDATYQYKPVHYDHGS